MRVAKTKEFKTLVDKYGLIQETVSDSIVKYLLEDGDFEEDGHDIWGQTIDSVIEIAEQLNCSVKFNQVGFFFNIFKTFPDDLEMELFESLVVIGDHDCPECGGEMITIDSNLETIMDSNGVQEPYDRIIGELKECSNCGHQTEVGAYFD